jgi:hypothetical protein
VNRAEAVDVLEVVVAVWPRVEQTHNAPDVWATIFGAVPADAVLEAVKDFISAGSAFPPSASEVLKLVADRETDVPLARRTTTGATRSSGSSCRGTSGTSGGRYGSGTGGRSSLSSGRRTRRSGAARAGTWGSSSCPPLAGVR